MSVCQDVKAQCDEVTSFCEKIIWFYAYAYLGYVSVLMVLLRIVVCVVGAVDNFVDS